jgi:hypothetical protein
MQPARLPLSSPDAQTSPLALNLYYPDFIINQQNAAVVQWLRRLSNIFLQTQEIAHNAGLACAISFGKTSFGNRVQLMRRSRVRLSLAAIPFCLFEMPPSLSSWQRWPLSFFVVLLYAMYGRQGRELC